MNEVSRGFFMELDKLIVKFRWKHRGSWIKAETLLKQNRLGDLLPQILKFILRLLGSVHWARIDKLTSGTAPRTRYWLAYDRCGIADDRRKEGPSDKWRSDDWLSLWRLIGFLPYTLHQINPRDIKGLNVKGRVLNWPQGEGELLQTWEAQAIKEKIGPFNCIRNKFCSLQVTM